MVYFLYGGLPTITFTCETCLRIRPVTYLDGKGAYMIGNKRYVIKDENADCADCAAKLREDDDKKRQQIRYETLEEL